MVFCGILVFKPNPRSVPRTVLAHLSKTENPNSNFPFLNDEIFSKAKTAHCNFWYKFAISLSKRKKITHY